LKNKFSKEHFFIDKAVLKLAKELHGLVLDEDVPMLHSAATKDANSDSIAVAFAGSNGASCEHEGCLIVNKTGTLDTNLTLFNFPGEEGGRFCKEHFLEGMVPICCVCNTTAAIYIYPDHKFASTCEAHKDDQQTPEPAVVEEPPASSSEQQDLAIAASEATVSADKEDGHKEDEEDGYVDNFCYTIASDTAFALLTEQWVPNKNPQGELKFGTDSEETMNFSKIW